MDGRRHNGGRQKPRGKTKPTEEQSIPAPSKLTALGRKNRQTWYESYKARLHSLIMSEYER